MTAGGPVVTLPSPLKRIDLPVDEALNNILKVNITTLNITTEHIRNERGIFLLEKHLTKTYEDISIVREQHI